MAFLRVKPGVKFTPIAPAGFRILGALERTARGLNIELTITCGSEAHELTDPHTTGQAYDLRTHDLTNEQKQRVLACVLDELRDGIADVVTETSGGLATLGFFGWIEHPGTDAEHLHVQRRKGTIYAPLDAWNA